MDFFKGKSKDLNSEYLEKAMDIANFGVWEWCLISNEFKFSSTAQKLHDVEKNTVRNFDQLSQSVYEGDRERFIKTINNSISKKNKFKFIYRIQNKKKEIRWIETSGFIVRDKKNTAQKVIGTCTDITSKIEFQERVNAQLTISNQLAKATSLKQISQKILMIIASSFGWEIGALWLKNREGIMVLENVWPSNNKKASIIKKKTNEIATNESISIVKKVTETGLPSWSENINRKDKSTRKLIFKNASIKSSFIMPVNDEGQTIGALEFYSTHAKPRDEATISILDAIKNNIGQVIERQRIIREQDQTRRQMQSIFNNVPFGITVENPKGDILNANKAVCEIFDYKPNYKFVGKNIGLIFSKYKILDINGVELKFKDRPAQKSLNSLQDVSETLLFINKKTNHKKYLLVTATLVKEDSIKDTILIKSYKDITETLEDQKQREFFVGVLSHELKNPIASIKAYSQLLKRKIMDNKKKTYTYADNIELQTNRIATLVNNVFDMSKLNSGKLVLNKRRIDLDKTIYKIIQNFSLTVKNRKIIRKGKTNLAINVDEDRLVQVLLNLLSNAVKYSSKSKDIEVILKKYNSYVTISVKDCGIGISKKHFSEVFKFFRVVPAGNLNKRHGLGMGLALSKSIIRAHGGDILLKSKPKVGSEFIIKLPI